MMNNHLSNDQLIGYIHQTLTDAEREEIDRHLGECAQCRGILSEHEAMQRRIHYGLMSDLRKAQPSAQMSFAAIAPGLKRGGGLSLLWTIVEQPLSGAVALAMLIALVSGLFFMFIGKTPPPDTSVAAGAMFRGNPQHTGAYDTDTVPLLGELAWSFETGDQIWTSPAIADGMVYFSSTDSYLYALDGQSGQLVWKFAGGGPWSSPAVVDGVIYFGFSSYLHALDSQTGRILWKFKTEGYWTDSSPVVAGDVVYFGSGPYLYALDRRTGQELWSFQTEGATIDASPTVADGLVYFGSSSDYFYALDSQTGALKWRLEAKYPSWANWTTAAVVDGTVYVSAGMDDKSLYVLDSQTGVAKWEFNALSGINASPAVAGDVVYVGSMDHYLYALDSQDGAVKWKFKTGGSIESSPLVVNGVVYVGSYDGYLYAVDGQTGQEKWRLKTGAAVISSPVVANGLVYVGSEDGTFYALR
jgi:outer membrane protein assembly factor BamB